MAKKNEQSSAHQIRMNFESYKYSLMEVPRILEMEYSAVYVPKDELTQDVIKSLEDKHWNRDNRVLMPKLKGLGYGDYTFLVGLINTEYFESREKLDTLLSKDWRFSEPSDNKSLPIKTIQQISLEEVLELFSVELSCDIDYYLANLDEMENDLRRKLDNLDVKNENFMKKLEGELLFNLIVKIFGEEDVDEKAMPSVTFSEFRQLFCDGNETYATAKRGNHYFIFYHETS